MAFSRNHAAVADGTFSATGATNWNAGHAVSGATVGGIAYFPTATSEAMSGMTWAVSGAAGEGLAFDAGTAVTNVPLLSISRINNNAAVVKGVEIIYTDTTSAAGFLPLSVKGGAAGTTNLFSLDKSGNTTFNTSATLSAPTDLRVQIGSAGSGYRIAFEGQGTATNLYAYSGGTAVGSFDYQGVIQTGNGGYYFANSAATITTKDTGVTRVAAGIVGIGTGTQGNGTGALFFSERTAPSAPAANGVYIYAEDNGGGKTRLMALFNSGAAQVIATEP